MRKKNDLCLAVITGVFLLSACANETDIVNLGGTTGSAEMSSDGVQSSSSGKGKSNIEDYFIDNAKYDHLSADEYRLHLKDGRRSITAVKENFAADTSYLIANSKNCFNKATSSFPVYSYRRRRVERMEYGLPTTFQYHTDI